MEPVVRPPAPPPSALPIQEDPDLELGISTIHTSPLQNTVPLPTQTPPSFWSDRKNIRFVFQIFISLVVLGFGIGMFIADDDPNNRIFYVTLITTVMGIWMSSPRTKSKNVST